MTGPLDGIRVVEVASWTFVPAAGAVLAGLGADVIKVEPPTGDPQRLLRNRLNTGGAELNPFVEIPNRGKRSVAIDLGTPAGNAALLHLVEDADVFLTSYLPAVRSKLRIDVDDIRAVSPQIIYVRGSGWGSHGPMADTGGFDVASAWATSGMAFKMCRTEPMPQPPAFFDLQGAMGIAGAVGTALFKRERTGQPSVVDVSLMHVAMWALGPDIASSQFGEDTPSHDRQSPRNPLMNWYRTGDGRWVYLVCLQGDRYWDEVCVRLGALHLLEDPRFLDAAVRQEHAAECVAALDAVFAAKSLAEVSADLADFTGVWAPALQPSELPSHPQVDANGYLSPVGMPGGSAFKLVSPPMLFDEEAPPAVTAAPALGQHTEEVLGAGS